MHELPVMHRILQVATRHAMKNGIRKVMKIDLEVGRLCDLEERWMRHYFDHITKGTLAEGAFLSVEWVPVVLECAACGHRRELEGMEENTGCPECGAMEARIRSGRDYFVKSMEGI